MICLLPHCAYLSETSRMLELHRALTELGLEVRVATHGGPHERLLAEAGIEYDVLGPGMSAARAAAFVGSAVGLGDPGQSMYDDAEIRMLRRGGGRVLPRQRDHRRRHRVHPDHVAVIATGRRTPDHRACGQLRAAGLRASPAAGADPAGRSTAEARAGLAQPDSSINRTSNRTTAYCGGFNRVAASLGVEGVPSLAALLLGDLSLVPEIPEVLGISSAELAAWTPGKGYRAGSQLTSSRASVRPPGSPDARPRCRSSSTTPARRSTWR